MRYELYYWPGIPGRGEFIRLALEEAGADWVDVVREKGMPAMFRMMDGARVKHPSFAPPFLRAGKLVVGQTANVLFYLGGKLGLAPAGEEGRLWTHQLQLTLVDFVDEVHDTHHPVALNLVYEEQKKEAKRRAEQFRKARAPKFLGWFERVLGSHGRRGNYLLGARMTYADLSLFQMVEGLRYAFPRAMKRLEKKHPRVVAVHDRVAARPRVRAYLASEMRMPFNEQGIFRRYPELDG